MQIQLLGADQRVVALLSCCLETGSQQQVFKLPDIARPVILPQLFQRQGWPGIVVAGLVIGALALVVWWVAARKAKPEALVRQ